MLPMKKQEVIPMPFDYEEAELDILENGGDPDYLSYSDPIKRNNYLRRMGLNPINYGGMSAEEIRKIMERQLAASAPRRRRRSRSDGFGCLLYALGGIVGAVGYTIKVFAGGFSMLSNLWEDVLAPYRPLLLGIPFCVLFIIKSPPGIRRFLHQILSLLGSPFRLARKWHQKDPTAALACLAGCLLGLALVGAGIFFCFR